MISCDCICEIRFGRVKEIAALHALEQSTLLVSMRLLFLCVHFVQASCSLSPTNLKYFEDLLEDVLLPKKFLSFSVRVVDCDIKGVRSAALLLSNEED